ncbi:MAG: hypothetical protein WC506_03750 [Candidatus Micrarchaeia archaeon]
MEPKPKKALPKGSIRIIMLAAMAIFLAPSLSFAAALSGTGCTTGGDCVVSATQTIDSGTAYYFNSLVINSGATVNVASSGSGAGGTVKFYVAGDANISGSIAADGLNSGGTSNPDGGGYGSYSGGSGGGVIWIYARALNFNGAMSVRGGDGFSVGSGSITAYGGGSGGTVRLVSNSLNYNGTISANGGNGGSAGGGAGGSVVILPLSVATLSSGSISASGGTSTAQAGGGSGQKGGDGTGQGVNFFSYGGAGSGGSNIVYQSAGGIANSNRNIKIYNSYVPAGSAFSITSSGSVAGLASLYFTQYSSKFSGLSWSYASGDYAIGVFDSSLNPMASIPVRVANIQNRSITYFNGTTASDGIYPMTFTSNGFFSNIAFANLSQDFPEGTGTLTCPVGTTISSYYSTYDCYGPCGSCIVGSSSCTVNYAACPDGCSGNAKSGHLKINCSYFSGGNSTWHAALVDNLPSSGYVAVFYGKGESPAHSASYIPVSAGSHMLEIAAMENAVYGPDGAKRPSLFLVNNSDGRLVCQGSTLNTSLNASCLLARTKLDAGNTRIQYSEIFISPIYSAQPQFSGMVLPNKVVVGGPSASEKLVGMASAPVMRAGNQYKRVVFYSPQSLSEGNFAYQETIPTDFAFGSNGTAYMAASDGTNYSCTFSLPIGKFLSLSSSNCPVMGLSIGYGGYLQIEYWLVAPAPDSFFTESKDYVFSEGSLSVQSSGG